MGHFLFQSPRAPPRRSPVSDTGYLSHFATMEEVAAAASPKPYALDLVLASLRAEKPRDKRQLRLLSGGLSGAFARALRLGR